VRGDGTIDEKEEAIVEEIGTWSARNGDAIFGTRPWRKFGEGSTNPPEGMLNEDQAGPFTAEDVRFTRNGDTLYAIFMEWPQRQSAIASLGARAGGVIQKVEMLDGQPLAFRRDDEGLHVKLPRPDGAFTPAIRISGRGLV
jgi:alpha-L-fucosidase